MNSSHRSDRATAITCGDERSHDKPVAAADRSGSVAAKLRPKEHGAYAILGIPIGFALLLGGVTWIGCFVACAAVSGFLAHEPLLVAWGHRGQRARSATPNAKGRLIVLLMVMCVTGVAALWLGNAPVRLSLVGCLVLASSSFAVAVAGRHRTLVGQLWGVLGLSAPCLPILLAAGVEEVRVLEFWVIWVLGFLSTTIAVRSVIAAQKRQPRWLHATILITITTAIAIGTFFRAHWVLATIPMVAASWCLIVASPPAKYLKQVGWTLVGATVATGILIGLGPN